jgi:hypothetical protein
MEGDRDDDDYAPATYGQGHDLGRQLPDEGQSI